jgi:NAD(P)-dependent dehydrogenase (short-subunit alcohol dehydrogenase family)
MKRAACLLLVLLLATLSPPISSRSVAVAAKTSLITGATDGIGRLTAQKLVDLGHRVLIHGRNPAKLARTQTALGGADVDAFQVDLSDFAQVEGLARDIQAKYDRIDVIINNAGVLKTSQPRIPAGLDVRFVVNTLAPYLLTKRLLPLLKESSGRVINLSSAAQAPVSLEALRGKERLDDDMAAYSQSKLALTAWTDGWAQQVPKGPLMIAVNPGSLLATKMVTEGFGVAGNDVHQGADILVRLALDASHRTHHGDYFDNDRGAYGKPHREAHNAQKTALLMAAMDDMLGLAEC